MSANVERVLNEIKLLTPSELEQVRRMVNELLATREAQTPEQKLQQKLFEAGLLTEIKPPITDFSPYRNRQPVKVEGQPISETIIEERR